MQRSPRREGTQTLWLSTFYELGVAVKYFALLSAAMPRDWQMKQVVAIRKRAYASIAAGSPFFVTDGAGLLRFLGQALLVSLLHDECQWMLEQTRDCIERPLAQAMGEELMTLQAPGV